MAKIEVKVMVQTPHPDINIGKVNFPSESESCRIGEHCFFDLTGTITIRDKVEIADEVRILTHKHFWGHSRGDRGKIQRIEARDLEICRDAFIGTRSTILGVRRIGAGAVVGACSCVTKDVPDFEVWAGNPAKKIGERGGE